MRCVRTLQISLTWWSDTWDVFAGIRNQGICERRLKLCLELAWRKISSKSKCCVATPNVMAMTVGKICVGLCRFVNNRICDCLELCSSDGNVCLSTDWRWTFICTKSLVLAPTRGNLTTPSTGGTIKEHWMLSITQLYWKNSQSTIISVFMLCRSCSVFGKCWENKLELLHSSLVSEFKKVASPPLPQCKYCPYTKSVFYGRTPVFWWLNSSSPPSIYPRKVFLVCFGSFRSSKKLLHLHFPSANIVHTPKVSAAVVFGLSDG